MRSTITLNGKNSSEIEGLLIQSLPPISKPLMRTQIDEIDGRDGDIVTPLGFSAYTKEITIGLYGDFDINEIISYFNSKGTVTFSNEPDMYYNYQIINQIDFERLIRYRTATVAMHCQPFKYSTTEGADILSSSDNFATLDQSINTDAQYFTYTSNVQNDVTATRNSVGTGSKFFATFTMNVVEGITYYFKGSTANVVTMYGYKDRIWGTSAGFSGRKLTSYSNYTATYTGTLIIGFYGAGNDPLYIRNFFVTNETAGIISGEGNDIVLEGTTEAPFLTLTAKGDTYQQTSAGYNLIDLVPITSMNVSYYQQGTLETVFDTTLNKNVVHYTGNNIYPSFYYTLPNRLESGKYYALKFTYKSKMGSTATHPQMWFSPNWSTNAWDVTGVFSGNKAKGGDGDHTTNVGQSSTWKTTSRRFYVDPTQYADVSASYSRIVFSLSYNSNNDGLEGKELWLADAEVYEITQAEWDAADYTSKDYEPYSGGGGIPSPNPDYQQDVNMVTGEQNVLVHGKNILDFANTSIGSAYLSTYTKTDNSLTVTMTSDNKYASVNTNTISCEAGKTYTISLKATKPTTTGAVPNVRIGKNDSEVSNIIGYAASTLNGNIYNIVKTFTADSDFTLNVSYYPNYDVATIAESTFYDIQIEQGSTATNYEPYQSQEYEINLGKNLLDTTTLVDGYVTSTGTFETIHNQAEMRSGFIKVTPKTNYTFSIIETSSTYQSWFGVGEYSSNNTDSFIRRDTNTAVTATSITFTTSATTHYVVVSARNMAGATKVQLESGDATSYAPYFTPIELCKIGNYQDYIYKSGDDWYVKKECGKVVLNGSENYAIANTDQPRYPIKVTHSGIKAADIYSHTNWLFCDKFYAFVSSEGDTDYAAWCTCRTAQYDDIIWFFIPTSFFTATTGDEIIAEYKSWLSDNNTTVYYILSTPSDTKITDSTLIEQLESLSNAHAYENITYITTTATGSNLPHIIAASAAGKVDGTVTNSGNTIARPKLTIFGSGNIGVYLNGIQIFQIAMGSEGHITIDTEAMEAYQDTTDNLKNRLVTGDYSNFVLQAGDNQISFSGNATMCVVENYSRWL